MEQKSLLLSALGVGVGVGVGLGLASGQSGWTGGGSAAPTAFTLEDMEKELIRLIVDGRESHVRFDEFPYYLSEQTRALLTSAAYVHLRHADVSKYTRNLSPASKAILLSGPSELYQQMLARALAHYFESKLLLLDVTDFSLKIHNKYGTSKESSLKRSPSESTLERLSGLFSSFSLLPPEQPKGNLKRQSSGVDLVAKKTESLPRLRRNASASDNINALASQCSPANPALGSRTSALFFDEKLLIQALYKVLVYVSKAAPIVLYLRDVDKLLFRSQRFYNFFQQMLKKLSGNVLILGSRVVDLDSDYQELDERLHIVFPYNIEIKPPDEEHHLVNWKYLLEKDMNMIQTQDNKNHIMEVLSSNDLDCDDLDSICVADTMALSKYIEEVVVSAISHHLMNNKDPEYRNGKLVISSKSLSYGLNIFQGKFGNDRLKLEAQAERAKEAARFTAVIKTETKPRTGIVTGIVTGTGTTNPENTECEISVPAVKVPEVVPDNEFEKRIRPEVIPANEINVTFADIGALDDMKESLQELVMLPLRRPDLFKGGLLKPCRGILLFGPPGTGKTMLAKAIAREAGASFINVSMSTIASKWFGEDEKNVRALFTLAAKVSPTIIFVDEVDSMLGQRTRVGEHEAMRKIKNEFMAHWDGLLTKPGERILVLAATNRPFDLDEAIIRRFERRIMVGLPSIENREKIFRTLLAKEKVEENVDFAELAARTEGYTGSDLKNLCTTAAYRPVRELIKQERLKDQERKKNEAKGKILEDISTKTKAGERVITMRPLNMADLKEAMHQVAASFSSEGAGMNELKQWNDLYGEGGSRKKEQLSYFL
ncbi:DUO1-activated ATPase 1 [Hibiscus trionum]|uniref:DUO1-activated ATPase 1 n=1 Tax=Hibiscus trionum TaxID=183268 RepID=A0A9W7IGM0_HIBTR|nr:DUO1-activated ATPase 1 [Hibiscus trionum]